jgi:hypothetical protein
VESIEVALSEGESEVFRVNLQPTTRPPNITRGHMFVVVILCDSAYIELPESEVAQLMAACVICGGNGPDSQLFVVRGHRPALLCRMCISMVAKNAVVQRV